MDQELKEKLLAEFDTRLNAYTALSLYSRQFLSKLLEIESLKVLSTSDRVKDRASLEEKLGRPGKNYEKLQQVTDLVGLRVVTFFEDDVNIVASIVNKEFELVPEYCVDKRYDDDPHRFGYRSLHYVCKLSPMRRELTETGGYRDELFEIQIRSILQHAWAEIEHLGYKSAIAIPNSIKHRMSRVAGLLEIADREFLEVRDESIVYREKIALEMKQNVLSDIELNSISYLEFISTSPLVKELDSFINDDLHFSVNAEADADEDFLVECLRTVDIDSIEKLQEKLEENMALLKAFAQIFLSTRTEELNVTIGPAISIFHLSQILALKHGGIDALADFYEQQGITGTGSFNESAQDTSMIVKEAETAMG